MKENPIYLQSLWKKIWYAYKTYERKSDIPTKLMKENWLFSLNLYMNIATISQRLENWIESSDWKFWYDISKLQHGLRSGFSLVLFTVCCLYHLLFFAYNRGMGWGERGGGWGGGGWQSTEWGGTFDALFTDHSKPLRALNLWLIRVILRDLICRHLS